MILRARPAAPASLPAGPHGGGVPVDARRRQALGLAGAAALCSLPGAGWAALAPDAAAGARLDAAAAPAPVPTGARALPPLFDDLEERTFRFFWDTANPANGLVPDRWPSVWAASIAAVGFALTAYPIGVQRGFITRAQARGRVLATLRFFANAPQGPDAEGISGHQGFFYHFLDLQTGMRAARSELSTIDTSLLLGGVLFCMSWFDQDEADEAEIRRLADLIYGRVNWNWAQVHDPLVTMGWTPERGFIDHDWVEYDEAMILYLLALGSPTYPVAPLAWKQWTRGYHEAWGRFQGYEYLAFAPLFGHQFSHTWVDFRGIADAFMRDRGLDYFENSRRATYAQRAYAIANPGDWNDYGEFIWGLTACDGPAHAQQELRGRTRQFHAYAARGAGRTYPLDDGTIAPAAAASSLPFAPEIVVPAVQEMHFRFGDTIYGRYGFLDSFNRSFQPVERLDYGRMVPGFGWVAKDYIGIDQGTILGMLANHRDGIIWRTMRTNPYIARGLRQAGFTGGWLDAA